MQTIKIVTIGVFGFSEAGFFDTLVHAGVDVFCDIRWRRGVRGAEYAFVNHKRLAARLESLGIAYLHLRELAPPPEVRQQQYAVDQLEKVAKRKRETLSPAFIAAYENAILSSFVPQDFFAILPKNARVAALFCVERSPAACHRSLLAARLETSANVPVEHFLPEG